MGTKISLADALFPSVQQRLLALLFGQPQRSFPTGELIRLAQGGTGGVHRLLERLAAAGWVTVTRLGNQKHYRANAGCPAFEELRGLVEKTLAPSRATQGRRPRRTAASEEPAPAPAAPTSPAAEDGWKSW